MAADHTLLAQPPASDSLLDYQGGGWNGFTGWIWLMGHRFDALVYPILRHLTNKPPNYQAQCLKYQKHSNSPLAKQEDKGVINVLPL